MCDYICHKGKHLELTQKKWANDDYKFETRREYGALLGNAPLCKTRLGGIDGYFLVADGVERDVIELGERVLEKWERFFKDNGI